MPKFAFAIPDPLGHVTELEIPFVPEQAIPLERGHVHVVSAVIVVIAHGDAHAVHLDIQPAGRGDIGERAVLVIAIQGVEGALGAGLPVPRGGPPTSSSPQHGK